MLRVWSLLLRRVSVTKSERCVKSRKAIFLACSAGRWLRVPQGRAHTLVGKLHSCLVGGFVSALVRMAAEVTQLVVRLGSDGHATRPAKDRCDRVLEIEEEGNSSDSLYSSGDCSNRHGIPRVDPF
jgi:hypothetical protein